MSRKGEGKRKKMRRVTRGEWMRELDIPEKCRISMYECKSSTPNGEIGPGIKPFALRLKQGAWKLQCLLFVSRRRTIAVGPV